MTFTKRLRDGRDSLRILQLVAGVAKCGKPKLVFNPIAKISRPIGLPGERRVCLHNPTFAREPTNPSSRSAPCSSFRRRCRT